MRAAAGRSGLGRPSDGRPKLGSRPAAGRVCGRRAGAPARLAGVVDVPDQEAALDQALHGLLQLRRERLLLRELVDDLRARPASHPPLSVPPSRAARGAHQQAAGASACHSTSAAAADAPRRACSGGCCLARARPAGARGGRGGGARAHQLLRPVAAQPGVRAQPGRQVHHAARVEHRHVGRALRQRARLRGRGAGSGAAAQRRATRAAWRPAPPPRVRRRALNSALAIGCPGPDAHQHDAPLPHALRLKRGGRRRGGLRGQRRRRRLARLRGRRRRLRRRRVPRRLRAAVARLRAAVLREHGARPCDPRAAVDHVLLPAGTLVALETLQRQSGRGSGSASLTALHRTQCMSCISVSASGSGECRDRRWERKAHGTGRGARCAGAAPARAAPSPLGNVPEPSGHPAAFGEAALA